MPAFLILFAKRTTRFGDEPNKFNTDRTSKELASKVFNIAKDLGLQITFDESLPSSTLGRYTNNNTIRLKKSFLERDIMNDKKGAIMLHEVIHAVSMYALSDQIKSQEKSKALNKFKEEVTSLYEELKNHSALKGERGTKDIYEFVAELANPIFREKIQSIDRDNNATNKIEKKSFWSRLINAFKQLLGIHVTSDYYQRSMNALDKALNAFDIDTYMRYNGIKNDLRKGYNAKEWEFNSMSDKELKSKVGDYFEKKVSSQPQAAKETNDYNIDNSNVNDILSDNKKADILEFIDNMSGQQLRDELSVIKQESADYDLVNGIEEEHKHSGKAVPQDFTFGDGTTIKAPFRPNEQQIVALNEMDRFLKSNETSMTLSGYAGTGKTSLMEMIAKKAVKDGNAVQFCASTNKAAKVLGDKVSKADFDAKTLHKVFGIKIETNPKSKKYDAKDVVNVIKPPKVTPNTTVIIDEASMINKENYDLLNEVAKAYNLKLIYVGDEAQLAPVGETEVSKVFSNGDGKVIRLTQVERTDDNAILKEATDIRNGKPLSGVTSFNSKGEGVAYIKPNHQNAIDEVLNQYVKGLKKNPDYFRVLAYYNATVSEYNTKVRSLLGFDSPTPRVGEPMTGYTNWGYMWWDQSYRLVNSEAYKVSKVEKPMTTTFVVDDGTEHGTPISLEYTPITLKDSLGNEDTFDYIDIKNNEQNRKAATLLAEKKQELWDKANRLSKSAAKPLYQEINRIEQFLFVNDDIKSSDGERTLQSKVIDFGYAMTVHKSQGSTFTHVLMDDVDIARGANEESKGETTFTDINLDDTLQEASDENVVSMGEEIDLGDDNTTPQATPPTTNPNHVDKRQQLEYVAVSRATDTVTSPPLRSG